MTVKATSDAAFRRLIGRILGFYRDSLFNPHWGEQIALPAGQHARDRDGVSGSRRRSRRRRSGGPFLDWLAGSPQDFNIVSRR